MSKSAKVVIIIAAILAGALVVFYFLGRNHFTTHFFPGTVINGQDVSDMTVSEVKNQLQQGITDYTLTIKERDGEEEKITGADLGLEYQDDGDVEELLAEQDADLWIAHVGGNKTFDTNASFTYNEAVVDTLLKDLNCLDASKVQKPTDAYVQDNGTLFEIVPETEGNEIEYDTLREAVVKAISTSKTTLDLDEEDLYVHPAVYSDDPTLQSTCDQMNALTAAYITYDFTDRQFTVDRTTIQSWIVDNGDGTLSISRDLAAAWVREMAIQTDTFGLEHQFTTHNGNQITLAGGGDYGWCIDQDATTDQLLAAIDAGQVTILQPEYLYTAMDRTVNDIGGTYVEISITEQHMWVYKDGQLLVDTPVVTGCHNKGFDTPSGSVWAIDGKKEDMQFTIFDIVVKYWLPFNGDCGIHPATWFTDADYTTTTYLDNGSHGCINTPDEACRITFEAMEIGYPVVVYYSEDQVVGPEPTQEVHAG